MMNQLFILNLYHHLSYFTQWITTITSKYNMTYDML